MFEHVVHSLYDGHKKICYCHCVGCCVVWLRLCVWTSSACYILTVISQEARCRRLLTQRSVIQSWFLVIMSINRVLLRDSGGLNCLMEALAVTSTEFGTMDYRVFLFMGSWLWNTITQDITSCTNIDHLLASANVFYPFLSFFLDYANVQCLLRASFSHGWITAMRCSLVCLIVISTVCRPYRMLLSGWSPRLKVWSRCTTFTWKTLASDRAPYIFWDGRHDVWVRSWHEGRLPCWLERLRTAIVCC